eukprot:PhM_4_TR4173/c0_g2_i1/m.78489
MVIATLAAVITVLNLHLQRMPVDDGAVQPPHRLRRIVHGHKADEAEATAAPSHAVAEDGRRHNGAVAAEQPLEIRVLHRRREVAHEQIRALRTALRLGHAVSRREAAAAAHLPSPHTAHARGGGNGHREATHHGTHKVQLHLHVHLLEHVVAGTDTGTFDLFGARHLHDERVCAAGQNHLAVQRGDGSARALLVLVSHKRGAARPSVLAQHDDLGDGAEGREDGLERRLVGLVRDHAHEELALVLLALAVGQTHVHGRLGAEGLERLLRALFGLEDDEGRAVAQHNDLLDSTVGLHQRAEVSVGHVAAQLPDEHLATALAQVRPGTLVAGHTTTHPATAGEHVRHPPALPGHAHHGEAHRTRRRESHVVRVLHVVVHVVVMGDIAGAGGVAPSLVHRRRAREAHLQRVRLRRNAVLVVEVLHGGVGLGAR